MRENIVREGGERERENENQRERDNESEAEMRERVRDRETTNECVRERISSVCKR